MKKRAGVVERFVVLVVLTLVIGLVISVSSASGPSFPLLLHGEVSYKDGSPASNVEVSVKNEASGECLVTTTDEKGLWSIEVSGIAHSGDEVLVIAKDAWNNKVSKKVEVTVAPQEINLAFEVPLPTTTPPPVNDDGDNDEEELPSGTQNETEQDTEQVIPPTTSPSPSPGVSNANVSEKDTNRSQSNQELGEGKENTSSSIVNHKRGKSSMAEISIFVAAVVIGVAFVTLLIYNYKHKHTKKNKRV